MVGTGLISYSAYLWHQPIFAFSRIYTREAPPDWVAPVLIVFTLALSCLSWRFVERPFRNRNTVSARQLTSSLLACSALLVFFCLAAHKTHGVIGRLYDQPIAASDHYIAYNQRKHVYRSDTFSDDHSMKLLVVGDSFGRDVVNILRKTYDLTAVELVYRDDLFACDFESRVGSGGKDIQRRLFDAADLVLFASN